MQKAIVCLVYWDDHSSRDKKLFVEAMNMHCNPLIEAYDDDDILEQNNDGDEMQKAVIQLRVKYHWILVTAPNVIARWCYVWKIQTNSR